ncbi:uncharacterized protein LOC120003583 [Tripterygium wilfordii]|uniref:uncharacterized protein LOC120003583 n=1 Tax=Tripterygium wilfordii TaxID=458696 RepID=UPI0018F820D3|nr:uncharacterized protein LOC120003583 [Tripterygium wilfordii]
MVDTELISDAKNMFKFGFLREHMLLILTIKDLRKFGYLKQGNSSTEKKNEGCVTFGDNSKGKILGKGSVGNPSSFHIKNVLLVAGLSFNLISISQLADMGYIIVFDGDKCLISGRFNNMVITGKRSGNVYMIDMHDLKSSSLKCFAASDSSFETWHRRLGHRGKTSILKLPRYTQYHSQEHIIGDLAQGMATRSSLSDAFNSLALISMSDNFDSFALISQIEPKNISKALQDTDWIIAMQEELSPFERNNVWNLVPQPENKTIIGSRWV